ncbi:MAG: ABC-F family ATP-binding cassette domain-containing protein [Blautia sp.]|nr:ABC-F family ATP-binding cassette domain-containing protein [Blautia sp.]
MLYQIINGTVSLGGQEILSHLDFEIKGSEKIAVVGRNGAGKTTLLRLLAGELELDRDDKRMQPGIRMSRRLTIGMLKQNQSVTADQTIEELLLESCPAADRFSRERFDYETEYDRMFTGFGFLPEDKKRRFSTFSGGEQTKIALIRLLLQKPDILLLDEPTNHLDIPTVEWLEGYLKQYPKAVVFVSHDRFFLDQVVDVVCELRGGKLSRYPGNYTHYREQKRKDIALAQKAYTHQQEELARLNELIERFKHKPKKAAFARSRKKIIERMEKVEKPEEDDAHIFTGDLEPLVPGSKWVLETEHLKIGYEQPLLELTLRVKRGQKIGVIGDNGVGKSTFLKTAAKVIEPLKGKCTLGNRTMLGYFDQQTAEILSDKTVFEHFHDLFPVLTEKEVRQTLGAYLFSGRAAQTKVSSLSGGEKSRLILAELLTSRPNLLILDEPTNHMDIPAKETLESAFQSYRGTILFVSHDRYFIRQVADAILLFEDGKAYYYPFGYEHYLEHSRKGEGQELTALLRAEDEALIAGLRAVPKKERRFIRELTTEEAYLDWQLRLAGEQLQESEDRVAALAQRQARLQELYIQAELEQVTESVSYQEITQDLEQLTRDLKQAENDWTEKCLAWYEIWKDISR